MPITSSGHPWGGERESAKMTGFWLPPPNRGLRVCRLRGEGDMVREPTSDPEINSLNDDRNGGDGDRTLSSIGRADHQGNVSSPTRSRRRPTSSTLHRGHRDDQCGSRCCPESHGTKPARRLSRGSGSGQGCPGSPGSGQGCPGSPGSGQGCSGSPGCSLRSGQGGSPVLTLPV
jgi:hypothetical protein